MSRTRASSKPPRKDGEPSRKRRGDRDSRARASQRDGKKSGSSRKRRGQKTRPRWVRVLIALTKVGLALAAIGLAGLVVMFWYYGRDLPSVQQLRDYQPPQTTRVLDRDGRTIGETFTERRTLVSIDRIPRNLVLSVLAAEDADFYQHEGLDYPGIVRALARDITAGRPAQGASTITQQVVKLLLLSPERTLKRKVRELILARRLEQELEKEEILHLYLNHINFGHGRYGVQEASQFYFGKNVESLSLAECALLAGLPQAPTRLSPRSHPDAARRRQRYVLRQLEEKRAEHWPDLSVADIEAAREAEIALVEVPDVNREAPEVLIVARRYLREIVGDEAYARGGYTIHTTIDLELQRAARRAVQHGLSAMDERYERRGPLRPQRRPRPMPEQSALRWGRTYEAEVTGHQDDEGVIELSVGGVQAIALMSEHTRYNPRELTASRFAPIGVRARVSARHIPEDGSDEPYQVAFELGAQGAAVVIDPRTRGVTALVGGYENIAGFNRATQAIRQPGSTFKPFVYGLALQRRTLTPASIMLDAPAVYHDYRPQNYETWNYGGDIRLREALARSINVVAIRVIDDLGPESVVDFARQLGITADLEPSLSLALGASDVSPIEMVNAYATFAAGGVFAGYRFVERITGPGGEEVPLPDTEEPRRVLSQAEAFMITSMLTSVVDSGTARGAQALGHPAAGKTGTSNEARDAWFVGYTNHLVAGVWVGFDDHRPLGRRESGGRSALPIWLELMQAGHRGLRPSAFVAPEGVVKRRIDSVTGLLVTEEDEDGIEEFFLSGTEPTEFAPDEDLATPEDFLMEQFEDYQAPQPAGESPEAPSNEDTTAETQAAPPQTTAAPSPARDVPSAPPIDRIARPALLPENATPHAAEP